MDPSWVNLVPKGLAYKWLSLLNCDTHRISSSQLDCFSTFEYFSVGSKSPRTPWWGKLRVSLNSCMLHGRTSQRGIKWPSCSTTDAFLLEQHIDHLLSPLLKSCRGRWHILGSHSGPSVVGHASGLFAGCQWLCSSFRTAHHSSRSLVSWDPLSPRSPQIGYWVLGVISVGVLPVTDVGGADANTWGPAGNSAVLQPWSSFAHGAFYSVMCIGLREGFHSMTSKGS